MSNSANNDNNDDDIIVKALAEIRRLKAENAELRAGHAVAVSGQPESGVAPIAVIGFACRTPGAGDNPEAFWHILKEGLCTITEVPPYRWSVDQYYDANPDAPGKMRCRYGSFLGRVEDFDCRLFGISPVEASYMDPQQRLLLELSWEALEDANMNMEALKGSSTGVFVGQSGFDFAAQHMTEESLCEITPYVGTGCASSPAAGRISYTFDFKGPSYVVDTACSSSLVALHNACQSLRQGESTLALVGAANLILAPGMSINFDKVGMLCEDGVVKTFDKDAHGVVRAEGGGMVVLKRLDAALRDGDRVDGVILGSAISQDGASSSLMAPSGTSQKAVMQAALKTAAISPDHIDVVEAHGTATALGDPTELTALLDVYCRTPRSQPLIVGSVKTNFGHMEASAGIVGFIKLLLALRNDYLPRHLNYTEGHPDIDWANEAIEVCAQGKPWPRSQRRRVAGLSGFGFSGTNAHVILAEAPEPASAIADGNSPLSLEQTPQLLMLSAATPVSLQRTAGALADWMENNPDIALARVCHTWATRRKRQVNRLAMVATDREQAIARLRRFGEAGKAKGCASGTVQSRTGRLAVAMVCGGHGAQYHGMSASLYQAEPVFRAAFDRASAIASQYCDSDLAALLHTQPTQASSKLFAGNRVEGELGKTLQAQLAIFCVQYGLAQQWQAWGVSPKVLLGHSLGEYTAACLAEVFSLEDAIMLIAERARLMDAHTPPGAMLTAFHDETAVQAILANYADAGIAAVNGPGIILVAGAEDSIADIAQRIDADGGRTTSVPIDRAFHSPLVDDVLPNFRRVLERVHFSPPKIPLISNLTGTVADQAITTVDYWLRHSRAPVQFMKGMQTLHAARYDAFIDLSPEPVMMGLDLCFQEIRAELGSKGVWVPSLRNGVDDQARMLESFGKLYCLGFNSAPTPSVQTLAQTPVRLPTYRFDRQRCWSAAAERGQQTSAGRAVAASKSAVSDSVVAGDNMQSAIPASAQSSGADDIHRVMLEHMAVVDQYLALTEGNR
ncbi:MAG: type I polyketide synthase [Pseudohongiella sp.]|uniref:type I polyketide synthase n=1 Tax=Pseudohongiella sp. TaxID=1979412 RepID=UPI0034A0241F